MKLSIRYTIIILAIGIVAAIVADWFLQKGLEKSNEDVIGKLNEIINDTTYYDVLCLGSSRTIAHINPEVITNETGLSVYNAGMNGGCMIDFNALFKVYLARHPAPKMVIIHVDEFTFETQVISELPRYFPFIKNKTLYENLVKYDKNVLVVKYIPFLRLMYYNDLFKWIAVKSWLNIEARDEYKLINGYRVNKSKWSSYRQENLGARMKAIQEMQTLVEEEKKGEPLFSEILELCKQYNIKLLFTSSPIIGGDVFKKYENTIHKIEQMSAGYKPNYLWMHKEQWSPDEYYYDFTHMNNLGADKFSKYLSDFINKSK